MCRSGARKRSPGLEQATSPSLDLPRPPLEVVDGEEEHEVEAIINHWVTGRKRKTWQYLVSWKGWESFENSWEPESHLKHAMKILKAYKKKHKLK